MKWIDFHFQLFHIFLAHGAVNCERIVIEQPKSSLQLMRSVYPIFFLYEMEMHTFENYRNQRVYNSQCLAIYTCSRSSFTHKQLSQKACACLHLGSMEKSIWRPSGEKKQPKRAREVWKMYRADLKFGLSNRSHWWESASSNVFFFTKSSTAQHLSAESLSAIVAQQKLVIRVCFLDVNRTESNESAAPISRTTASGDFSCRFEIITLVLFLFVRPRCSLFARARLSSIGLGTLHQISRQRSFHVGWNFFFFMDLPTSFTRLSRASMWWYGKRKYGRELVTDSHLSYH